MIQIEHDRDGYLVCRASGTLTSQDYQAAVAELENEFELRGRPMRLLVALEDFHGWDMGGLMEELRFDVKYGNAFERIAVIGESRLQEWAILLSKPFFGAEIRYFDRDDRAAARAWLLEGGEAARTAAG